MSAEPDFDRVPDLPYAFPGLPPAPPKRPVGPTLKAGALLLLAAVVAGVPFGFLWRWIAPDTSVVKTRVGPYPLDPQPEQYIAADGWFALLGFALGIAVSLAAWWLLRRHRGPIMLAAVALGSLGAAAVGWQAGRLPGHAAFARWVATVAPGTHGTQPADLRGYGVLLVPAFAAVITYTLLAGWSHEPDLAVGAAPAAELSSGWPDEPAPIAEPVPPAPGAGAQPPG